MNAPHDGDAESPATDGETSLRPHLKSIEPEAIAWELAELLELTSSRVDVALRAGWYPKPPPPLVPSVDVEAWLAWALAGLPAFCMGMPVYGDVREIGIRAILVLSLARDGDKITEVERTLGTSRKVLRANLRRLGLYPPKGTASELLGGVKENWGGVITAIYAGATAAGLHRMLRHVAADEQVVLRGAAEIVERMGWAGG